MYRLQGRDAFFLYQETPTALMHTLKVLILDPAHSSLSDQQLLEGIKNVLRAVPVLRQRVVEVPLSLHHPMMVDDPDFDLEQHICRAALPRPGGMAELDAMVAQIAQHRLDRTRPLWEAWILEGFHGNRIVVVLKVHHTLADGIASLRLLTEAWSGEVPAGAEVYRADRLPGKWKLLRHAAHDQMHGDLRKFPAVVRFLWQRFIATHRLRKAAKVQSIQPLVERLPRTHFNRALSSKRSFATVQLSLGRVKQLKTQLNGTVNDVFLALVTGVLRRYLQERGELPDTALAAAIPISADATDVVRTSGNNTANMYATLPVQIEDPLQRYYTIKSHTEAAKRELEAFGKQSYALIFQYMPPILFRWVKQREFTRRPADQPGFRQLCNLVVSNVPGPQQKLRTRLGTVDEIYSVGPLIESVGLNITVWSYCDHFNISIIACRRAIRDAHCLSELFPAALAKLEQAAGLGEPPALAQVAPH